MVTCRQLSFMCLAVVLQLGCLSCSSSLQELIKKQDLDAIESRISSGSDPNDGVFLSSRNGYENVLRLLLEKGANPNHLSNGWSPLHLASLNGHEDIVELLLSQGADPNLPNEDYVLTISDLEDDSSAYPSSWRYRVDVQKSGCTPIFAAVRKGNFEIFKELLANGANVQAQCTWQEASIGGQTDHSSFLVWAIREGNGASILEEKPPLGLGPLKVTRTHLNRYAQAREDEFNPLRKRKGPSPQFKMRHGFVANNAHSVWTPTLQKFGTPYDVAEELGHSRMLAAIDSAWISGLRSASRETGGKQLTAKLGNRQLEKVVELCPEVEHLDLSHNPSLSDIAPLAQLTHLKSLNLGSTGVDDLGPLAELGGLTELNLAKLEARHLKTPADLEGLGSLSGLEVLDISMGSWHNLEGLGDLRSLKVLNCSWNGKLESLQGLGGLDSLREIDCARCYGLKSIQALSKLGGLRALDIAESHRIADFTPLSELNGLLRLSLPKNVTQQDLWQIAAEHPSLQYLDVSEMQPIEVDIQRLRKLLPECELVVE